MATLPTLRRRPLSTVAFDLARSIARAAAARTWTTLGALATRWLDHEGALPERDWLDVPFRPAIIDPQVRSPPPAAAGEILEDPRLLATTQASTRATTEPVAWALGRRVAEEIERRLASLATLLDEAADPVATVHRVRVATRRLRSLLELLGDELPRADASRKSLRRLGRALGKVRELDALAELLRERVAEAPPVERAAAEHVLEGIARRRAVAARRARRGCEELDLDAVAADLRGVADALVGRIVREPDAVTLAVTVLCDRVVESWPRTRADAATLDLAGLHALRILAKRMRHACELLAPALPDRTLRNAARAVQRELGGHRDASLLLTRLERRRAKLERRELATLAIALTPEIERLREHVASVRQRSHARLLELDRAVAMIRRPLGQL